LQGSGKKNQKTLNSTHCARSIAGKAGVSKLKTFKRYEEQVLLLFENFLYVLLLALPTQMVLRVRFHFVQKRINKRFPFFSFKYQ